MQVDLSMKQEIEELDDKGTKNPIEMREEVILSNREIELSVIRIQRMCRTSVLSDVKMVLEVFICLYHHKTLFTRSFWSTLFLFISNFVQSLHEIISCSLIVTRCQRLVYRMTRRVLPKIKRFIKNYHGLPDENDPLS